MAFYRRCLSIRTSLLARRSSPSFCHISHEDDRGKREEYRPLRSAMDSYVSQRRSFRSCVKGSSWRYSGVSFGVGSGLVGGGLCKNRYMSTSGETLADVIKEVVISQFPVLGEIIPAAESSLPVLAAQCLIDGVHSFAGLNWWSSIAVTTLLIRGVTIPFLIYEAKSYKMFQCSDILLMLLAKEAREGRHIVENMDPISQAETLNRLEGLCHIANVTSFKLMNVIIWLPTFFLVYIGSLLKGVAIRGPVFVSFSLAVTIMADKVPSFKNGGAFLFTDLASPDYTFILPCLTLMSSLACFRSFWEEKLTRSGYALHEDKGSAFYWKWTFRAAATCSVMLLPFSILLPQAVYCYMLTSNLFSLCINSYLNNPDVRKAWGFPELPVPTPSFYSSDIGRENWPYFHKR